MKRNIMCPNCFTKMDLVRKKKKKFEINEVHVHYLCSKCNSTLACSAKGRVYSYPYSEELHNARNKAHKAFDVIWKTGVMSRGDAYIWLAKKLSMPDVHMSKLNIATCELVVNLCKVFTNK